MKVTWFAVSFPTGKLKAFLIIFDNCSFYAHFSAFKWEIVNYFMFLQASSRVYIYLQLKGQNIMKKIFLTLWNQLLKIMTSVISKKWRLSLLEPFILVLFIAKLKVEILPSNQTQSHITKQLLTSISVDIIIYQPSKRYSPRPPASVNITFSGW